MNPEILAGDADASAAQLLGQHQIGHVDLAHACTDGTRVIIMDISGVAVVDTAVANHPLQITKTTRLMGCECTISGMSPASAKTMVELGIDVGAVRTTATLEAALAAAIEATRAPSGDAPADRH